MLNMQVADKICFFNNVLKRRTGENKQYSSPIETKGASDIGQDDLKKI